MRDQTRIPRGSSQAGDAQDAQQVLRQSDLDKRFLTLTRTGKITLNLARLKTELGMASMPSTSVVQSIETFEGAGTTGLVPDPTSEAGRYLKDDGEWDTPAGAGDMLKATYDGDSDGRVEEADALEDGTNTVTAAQARAHIDSTSNPHTVQGNNGGTGGIGVYDGVASNKLNFRNVSGVTADGTAATLDSGNKLVKVGLTNLLVPVGKLVPGSAHTFLISDLGGAAAEWRQCPDYGVMYKKNSTGTGMDTDTAVNNEFFMRGSTGAGDNLGFKPGLRVIDSLLDGNALSGTSFPSIQGSPQDGQPYYREDLDMLFVYDGTLSAWLSAAEWVVDGWGASSQNTGYLDVIPSVAYSGSYGHTFRYDVVCVEMAVCANASSTGTWAVYDDGTTTGDNVSIAAATRNEQKIASPATIAGGSIIAINQTAGTGVNTPRVRAVFRRIET